MDAARYFLKSTNAHTNNARRVVIKLRDETITEGQHQGRQPFHRNHTAVPGRGDPEKEVIKFRQVGLNEVCV